MYYNFFPFVSDCYFNLHMLIFREQFIRLSVLSCYYSHLLIYQFLWSGSHCTRLFQPSIREFHTIKNSIFSTSNKYLDTFPKIFIESFSISFLLSVWCAPKSLLFSSVNMQGATLVHLRQ